MKKPLRSSSLSRPLDTAPHAARVDPNELPRPASRDSCAYFFGVHLRPSRTIATAHRLFHLRHTLGSTARRGPSQRGEKTRIVIIGAMGLIQRLSQPRAERFLTRWRSPP